MHVFFFFFHRHRQCRVHTQYDRQFLRRSPQFSFFDRCVGTPPWAAGQNAALAYAPGRLFAYSPGATVVRASRVHIRISKLGQTIAALACTCRTIHTSIGRKIARPRVGDSLENCTRAIRRRLRARRECKRAVSCTLALSGKVAGAYVTRNFLKLTF